MLVFRTWGAEDYQCALLVDKREYRPIREMLKAEPGRPVGSRWKPAWVWLLTEVNGERLRYADLPRFSPSLMGVNRRARAVLEEVVSDDAEFLPVEREDDDHKRDQVRVRGTRDPRTYLPASPTLE